MRTTVLHFLLVLCIIPSLPAIEAPSTEDVMHRWGRILFPAARIHNTPFEVGYLVTSVNRTSGLQLILRVTFASKYHNGMPMKFEDGMESPNEKAKLRLIMESGESIPCENFSSDHGYAGSAVSFGPYPPSSSAFFSWRKKSLEPIWIEISYEDQRHFLELPYGFTSHPDKTPILESTDLGSPSFPTLVPPLKEMDQVISWTTIDYDYGEIIHGWRLSLKQSNPGDGSSEIILYREDTKIGSSKFLWQLETPNTSLEIQDLDGNVLVKGRKTGIRLHEDGMRRSDMFRFSRRSGTKRSWAKMIIKVDENPYSLIIPTSMFRFVHGQSRNHLSNQ